MTKKKFDPTDTKGYNHIKWWRHGESSVIFMVFHPRPPVNVVLPTKDITDELDQSAFFRSPPLPHPSVPEPSPSAKTEMQKPATTDLQKSANAEMQKSANAEMQKTETQRAALRKTYAKTSYRLCPEAFDAIEAAKRLLDRRFGLQASHEDIAETALVIVHEDLEKNGEQSELVKRLSATLQKQK